MSPLEAWGIGMGIAALAGSHTKNDALRLFNRGMAIIISLAFTGSALWRWLT